MSAPRPQLRGERGPGLGEIEVDWASLPGDWRDVPYRLRRAGETRDAQANRARALVAEGLVPAASAGRALAFADWPRRARSR